MLVYIGLGPRNYFKDPVLAFPREVWEVVLILSDKVRLVLNSNDFSNLLNHVFIFPPNSPHGWSSLENCETDRLVLHFTELPSPIIEYIDKNDLPFIKTKANSFQKNNLLYDVKEIYKTFMNPNNITMLLCERLSVDLGLLFLRNLSIIKNYNNDFYIISKVIAWYKEHIIECPNINDIAYFNNISVSHLRRLFHSSIGESPKKVFQKIQLERAKNLLLTTDFTIENISIECGFGDPSSFWRFFYKKTELTPKKWKELVTEKKIYMQSENIDIH